MTGDLGYFGDRRLEQGGALLLQRLVEVGQQGIKVRRLGGTRTDEMRSDINGRIRSLSLSIPRSFPPLSQTGTPLI